MNLTEFPSHVFPDEVREYVEALEKSSGLLPDILYSTALINFSTLIGASVRVKMNPTWIIYCQLWLAVIGDSGIKKSPNVNSMIQPIKSISEVNYNRFREELDDFNALDPEVRKSRKQPRFKRLSISDATFEAIQYEMFNNQLGLVIDRDEILGYFLDQNRYRSNGSELSLLSMYSGGQIDVARKSSDPLFVKNPFLNMVGGIQTDKLHQLLTEDRFASGFASRFIFTFPQNPIVSRGDRSDFQEAYDVYLNLSHRLYELRRNAENDPQRKIELFLDPEALELYDAWVDGFVDKSRNDPAERNAIKAYASKFEETCIRFAIILECVWCARCKREPTIISYQSIEYSLSLISYYYAQFMRVLKALNGDTLQSGTESFFLKKYYNNFSKQIERDDMIAFILDLIRVGHGQKEISKTFGIPESTISTWKKRTNS